MNLYAALPLTKIPRAQLQLPVYFSTHDLVPGQLVEVPLGRRKISAVIVKRYGAQEHRQQLRKSPFALKNITRILTTHPIFDEAFLRMAHRLADYYYEPLGLTLRRMLPPVFAKPTRPLLALLDELPDIPPSTASTPKTTLLIGTGRKERYAAYARSGAPYIFVAPEYGQLGYTASILPQKHNIALLAHRSTAAAWRNLWRDARYGTLDGIVGTRGVLFTPLARARTLFIERENSDAHKSWDQHPKLDTHRAALELREARHMNVVFGDTIPAVETWWRSRAGKWEVKKQAPTALAKPRIIDIRNEHTEDETSLLSTEVRDLLVRARATAKILLLANRRGLSSALVCRDCGAVVRCKHCDAPLVLHNRTLICHHCGVKRPAPSTCSACGGNHFRHLGGGTQRVEQEVRAVAPHLRIARVDSDATPTLTQQQHAFSEFRNGNVHVVIGTNMALKEYELPRLDASVVVSPDTLLMLPAYRSAERIFDTIWRLRTLSKKVFVQTRYPELPLFSLAQQRTFEPFFEDELKKREALGWPPFVQLIKLSFSHRAQSTAETQAKALTRRLAAHMRNLSRTNARARVLARVSVLGPAPAFAPRVGGRYAWYALLKWPRDAHGAVENLALRNRLLDAVPQTWDIDVDPIDVV